VAAHQHIEPDQLPFGEALRLLDIRERIAFEGSLATRTYLTQLAFDALDHFCTPIQITGIRRFFCFCSADDNITI
jgi:hypothetical protein